MVRSAAAILALLILPGIAFAQQAQGTHSVVDGDTLWDLSARYYGNPFDWRRIWNANQANIADPNLITPGQVLVIPGTEAPTPTETMPVAEQSSQPATTTQAAPAGNGPRTIFFQDTSFARAGVVRGEEIQHLAVPRDLVYSAPRVAGFTGDPEHTGVLTGAAGERNRNNTVRSYDRVHVTMNSPARVGDRLQIFKVGNTIEDVGRVLVPTGIIDVTDIVEDGVIGVITKEYGRILPGQFTGPMPAYALSVGQYAQAVTGQEAAMVVGFANTSRLQDVGFVAFLDVGTEDGVALGDEFTLFNTVDHDDSEGFLQVVGLQDGMAAARVVNIVDAVFEKGVVVRLTKKMR